MMDLGELLRDSGLVLIEAALIETLKRSGAVALHPRLENALLVYDEAGRKALTELYDGFLSVAREADVPILVCTPTWRANRERIEEAKLERDVNGDAAAFLRELRGSRGAQAERIGVGGLLGCRNDSYRPEEGLSMDEAEAFHSWQAERLARAGVDFLLAVTLPSVGEAAGMARALEGTGLPYLVSFVIDRTGRVLDGTSLEEAFARVDSACARPPVGFMINCAYPSFLRAETEPESVLSRLVGYQANASSLDPSDLDGAEHLQADTLEDWGERMVALHRDHDLKILGGCCGTGLEHLRYIVKHARNERDAETE